MTNAPDLAAAECDEQKARLRFFETAGMLAARLRPFQLVEDAATGASSRATDLAWRATKKARARPKTIAIVGCIVIAVLARRRLYRLIRYRGRPPGQAGHTSTLHELDKQQFGGGTK